MAWINSALPAARPQAVAALLRHFRDLDIAEEAFQDACLRAPKSWPQNGPPRDPAAWLIMVGRNAAIDGVRRRSKHQPLPDDDVISDLEDREVALVEQLDTAHYRDAVYVGTEVNIEQNGIPDVIPPEACYLGWQDSLHKLEKLVVPEINQ